MWAWFCSVWTRHMSPQQTKHSASVSQSVVSLWPHSVLRQRSTQTKVLSKCTTTVWLNPPPAPLDQQNGNSVTASLKLCSRPGSHISWWNYPEGNTKWFRIHFIWPRVLFLSALQTQGGLVNDLVIAVAVKCTVWDLQSACQMKVGEAERRRWEVVNAWGCLKITGTFTNEEVLHIGAGMQACITSRWQWVAGPSLVG